MVMAVAVAKLRDKAKYALEIHAPDILVDPQLIIDILEGNIWERKEDHRKKNETRS